MTFRALTYANDPDTVARPIDKTRDVGVALSGGGTRSASLSLGVLRALSQGRLIQPMRDANGAITSHRYLSCVSGGTWCGAPWAFLPRNHNEALFLGKARLPKDIKLSELRAADGSYAMAPAHAPLGVLMFGHLATGAGDEAWSRAVGDAFLRPFGLMGDKERFFTFDEASRSAIIARNPALAAGDFDVIERNDRPFLVMGMTSESGQSWVPAEITPLGVGSVPTMPNSPVGGGVVEPVGFDASLVSRHAPASVEVQLDDYRFSLADAVGASGAAMSAFVNSTVANFALAFPRFRYFKPFGQGTLSAERRFGDGGLFEHNGVIPLLRRGIRKLLICVNTDTKDPTQCLDIARLFGVVLPGHNAGILGPPTGQQVFRTADMAGVCAGLAANQGWHSSNLTLVANPPLGIPGGESVEVLWMYTWLPDAFVAALSQQMRDQLRPHPQNEFFHFPHIPTFDPVTVNFSYMPSLATVKLLAHLAYFQLTQTPAFDHLCALFSANVADTRARLKNWSSLP